MLLTVFCFAVSRLHFIVFSLSQVVSLVIKRPPHFAFKPGDYIFINIPAIATFEWHPYTISSAPEQGSHSLRDHNWKFLSNIWYKNKEFSP